MIFAILFAFSTLFTFTFRVRGQNLVDVLNQTERMTESRAFMRKWHEHPFSILIFMYMEPVFMILPVFLMTLFFIYPEGSMYISSFVFKSLQPYSVGILLVLGLIEVCVGLLHFAMVFTGGMICMVGLMCLKIWPGIVMSHA